MFFGNPYNPFQPSEKEILCIIAGKEMLGCNFA
jgi:hypothetical protein